MKSNTNVKNEIILITFISTFIQLSFPEMSCTDHKSPFGELQKEGGQEPAWRGLEG